MNRTIAYAGTWYSYLLNQCTVALNHCLLITSCNFTLVNLVAQQFNLQHTKLPTPSRITHYKICSSRVSVNQNMICDWICERGLIAFPILCIWPSIVKHDCEYGTNLKFGHLTFLTWFYSWEQFYINRLNTVSCN